MDEVKMLLSGILQQMEGISKKLDDMLQRWDRHATQTNEIRRDVRGMVDDIEWNFRPLHARSTDHGRSGDIHNARQAENITAEQRIWRDVLRVIRPQIGETVFDTRFGETNDTQYDAESDTLTVEGPTTFIGNWLQEKYTDIVETALNTVTGRGYRVTFVCQEGAQAQ